jgi:cytochrome oxidase Cu insertion factor (SCO1/SenC/PrrC family)
MTRMPAKLLFALAVVPIVLGGCPSPKTDPAAEPAKAEAAPAAKEGAPVGSAAPDFAVKDDAGTTRKLSDLRGKQPVLLAFYPKDFTSG